MNALLSTFRTYSCCPEGGQFRVPPRQRFRFLYIYRSPSGPDMDPYGLIMVEYGGDKHSEDSQWKSGPHISVTFPRQCRIPSEHYREDSPLHPTWSFGRKVEMETLPSALVAFTVIWLLSPLAARGKKEHRGGPMERFLLLRPRGCIYCFRSCYRN